MHVRKRATVLVCAHGGQRRDENSVVHWLPLVRSIAASEFRRLGGLTKLRLIDLDDLIQTGIVDCWRQSNTSIPRAPLQRPTSPGESGGPFSIFFTLFLTSKMASRSRRRASTYSSVSRSIATSSAKWRLGLTLRNSRVCFRKRKGR